MSIHWNDKINLEANLRKALRKSAEKYFEKGDAALNAGSHWKDLHKFRLATKRFRYTLELFEPVYGEPLRERLHELKKVQDYLGEANDFMTTRALLKDFDGMQKLRATLKEDANERLERLRKFWRDTFEKHRVTKLWNYYFDSES